MDTIIKWDYMEVLDTEEKIRALCHKGWEPVGVDSRNGIRILKRPCGQSFLPGFPLYHISSSFCTRPIGFSFLFPVSAVPFFFCMTAVISETFASSSFASGISE